MRSNLVSLMTEQEIDKLTKAVKSAHTVILSREQFDTLIAAAREANRLKLFVNDLSKKHADCTEGVLFEQRDLDQAQALLSLGVFGVIEAEALALAIAAARSKDRLECDRLRARVEALEEALQPFSEVNSPQWYLHREVIHAAELLKDRRIADMGDPGTTKAITPPYSKCPFPGCEGSPVLQDEWWVCSSGEPHFLWGTK